jgi:UDPglucose 6-dehydrogenase
MNEGGSCDLSFVEDAVAKVSEFVEKTNIIVRSTVPVGTSERLGVCVMPEFLTEANWKNDFINCEDWIVGDDSPNMRGALLVARVFQLAHKQGKIKHFNIKTCTTKEAELVKLTRNAFLATKVSFFNEIESFCQSMDISYKNVLDGVTLDKRIDSSHTSVPGPDGERGFGGKCFPKDASSLLYQMFQQGIDSYIINASLLRNQEVDRPSSKKSRDAFKLLRPMGRHNE